MTTPQQPNPDADHQFHGEYVHVPDDAFLSYLDQRFDLGGLIAEGHEPFTTIPDPEIKDAEIELTPGNYTVERNQDESDEAKRFVIRAVDAVRRHKKGAVVVASVAVPIAAAGLFLAGRNVRLRQK